jgi:hypothetical protein
MSFLETNPRFQSKQYRDALSEDNNFGFMSHFRNKVTLSRVVAEARKAVGAQCAFLYAMKGHQPTILATDGFSLLDGTQLSLPTLERLLYGAEAFEFRDMKQMSQFATARLVHDLPGWRYAVNAPVAFSFKEPADSFVTMICFDQRPRDDAPQMLTTLARFADITSDLMSLMSDFELSNQPKAYPESPVGSRTLFDVARESPSLVETISDALAEDHSPPDHIAFKFLLETLITRQRLRSRKSIHFLALRSWAKPIKQYQISALRSLKSDPPPEMIDTIATELANAFRAVHGNPTDACVTPVPCGHSGPNCLSAKLAQSVAGQLDLKCVEAFFCTDQQGSSHPKTNLRRPKMRLKVEIDRPVILIDDVATSGAHIEEAARILSQTSPSVWPIVWISD